LKGVGWLIIKFLNSESQLLSFDSTNFRLLKILCLSLVFVPLCGTSLDFDILVLNVQKGKFLAAEKFALLPALQCYSGEALQCRLALKLLC
jgi:hypothetical protein